MKSFAFGVIAALIFSMLLFAGHIFFSNGLSVPPGHLVVRVVVEDELPDFVLFSYSDSTLKCRVYERGDMLFVVPLRGEGTCMVCALFEDGEEVCEGMYVENGYRPVLRLQDRQVYIDEFF